MAFILLFGAIFIYLKIGQVGNIFTIALFFMVITRIIFLRKIKSIKIIDKEFLEIKGFFSKTHVKIHEVKKVGFVFVYYYLETFSGRRNYFIYKPKGWFKGFLMTQEAIQEEIFNRIKNTEDLI